MSFEKYRQRRGSLKNNGKIQISIVLWLYWSELKRFRLFGGGLNYDLLFTFPRSVYKNVLMGKYRFPVGCTTA